MIVEVAELADLPAIVALEEHFGVRWSEDSWRAELTGDGRLVLAARVGCDPDGGGSGTGELVGVACFQRLAEVVDLHRIVVAPSRRRLGLARAMLVAGLQWAIREGAARMVLEVEHDNEAAIALYRGHGFRPIAARADYYGPGADAVVMERPLEGVDADSVGMWEMEARDTPGASDARRAVR